MDHTPPPFFNRGPSPFVRIVLFILFSILFMVVDARQNYLDVIRQGVGVALRPLRQLADLPSDIYEGLDDFFTTQATLRQENQAMTQERLHNSILLQRYRALEAENAYLRKLTETRARVDPRGIVVEILSTGQDPFSRKVLVDKGAAQKIAPGLAVVDTVGVVGQVTRVDMLSSEVTLITDKDQAVPVEVVRNGLRAVVFGNGRDGTLNLPFFSTNADIAVGDVLVTSGIDGVYPAGLPVAVVAAVDRNSGTSFAKITCKPSAGVHHHMQLLVLTTPPAPPPPSVAQAASTAVPVTGALGGAPAAEPVPPAKPTEVKNGSPVPADAAAFASKPAEAKPGNPAPAPVKEKGKN
ncbi:MAG: rod shape-determining protein MreC [Sulfuricellaceae bacterium]|jgi:rod shape-determining protein MreC